ncbi:type I 3-dehydroquinate dehydratase [Candidatus Woesearchaeota archaeon]|nr:type I 3-dehydroquinate dehydratase [Candidatus Woesearchaeota archaeon]
MFEHDGIELATTKLPDKQYLVVPFSGSFSNIWRQQDKLINIAGSDEVTDKLGNYYEIAIEYRIDLCTEFPSEEAAISDFIFRYIEDVIDRNQGIKFVFTPRSVDEGGRFPEIPERYESFSYVSSRYRGSSLAVDIESAHLKDFNSLYSYGLKGPMVIGSSHAFESRSDAEVANAIHDQLLQSNIGVHVLKVAQYCSTPNEVSTLLLLPDFIIKNGLDAIVVPMGDSRAVEAGRYLTLAAGSMMTFCKLDEDSGSANGQPLLIDMVNNLHMISHPGRYACQFNSDAVDAFSRII